MRIERIFLFNYFIYNTNRVNFSAGMETPKILSPVPLKPLRMVRILGVKSLPRASRSVKRPCGLDFPRSENPIEFDENFLLMNKI